MTIKSDVIKTTGQLREFLARTITETRAGTLGIEEASRIAKLAAQMNESFYAEIKIARTRKELGQTISDMGELRIGSKDDE